MSMVPIMIGMIARAKERHHRQCEVQADDDTGRYTQDFLLRGMPSTHGLFVRFCGNRHIRYAGFSHGIHDFNDAPV